SRSYNHRLQPISTSLGNGHLPRKGETSSSRRVALLLGLLGSFESSHREKESIRWRERCAVKGRLKNDGPSFFNIIARRNSIQCKEGPDFFHVGFSRIGFLAFLVQESDSIRNGLRPIVMRPEKPPEISVEMSKIRGDDTRSQ
ncbi:unnamed protein product, partial [Scytosiphon promiscuus]